MRPSISVAIAGLVCFSSTYVSAQPNKQLSELQERCSRQAAEAFQREYGPGADRQDEQFNYENHYCARLNKCFFLEIAVSHKPTKLQNYATVRPQREQGVRNLCKWSY
jgi:hypothetical protein